MPVGDCGVSLSGHKVSAAVVVVGVLGVDKLNLVKRSVALKVCGVRGRRDGRERVGEQNTGRRGVWVGGRKKEKGERERRKGESARVCMVDVGQKIVSVGCVFLRKK